MDDHVERAQRGLKTAATRHTLTRETFRTSRLLDFCSERELVKQIGHSSSEWPLVVLKELVDNAIDESEEAGIAPVIRVEVSDDAIIIADSGRGIPAETIDGVRDFSVRTSSREAYVSPTRGQQGNALKTIVAMPFALDGDKGETLIESRGVAHRLTFTVDRIRQEPKVDLLREGSLVKNGTRITVRWPRCACSKLAQAKPRFLQVAEDFGWLNPHLTLSVTWHGERCVEFKASNPAWAKWRPSDPTSPHWYDGARLRRLMGAQIGRDQDLDHTPRTVRQFVSEFHRLAGTAKQKNILEEIGASRLSLSDFFGAGDRVNDSGIAKLLAAMQRHSRPVKPQDLGVIGRDHLAERFKAAGAVLESFKYQRAWNETDSIPAVIEAAFGWCPEGANERRIIVGVNWSPALGNPFHSIDGESLDGILAEQRSGRDEPIVLVLHLARPSIQFTDHGKTAVVIPGCEDADVGDDVDYDIGDDDE